MAIDPPREIETPTADQARDAPVESRAEYDNPPEESNVAVSDASAESNAIEHKEPTVEAENGDGEVAEIKDAVAEATKPVENLTAVSEPQQDSLENEKEMKTEDHEQTPTEEEAVGTNAVSIPSNSESTTANTAESAPDTQESHSEVDDHEVKDGDEPDHLSAEDALSQPESQASEELDGTHSEVEQPSPEGVSAPLEEPSSDSSETLPRIHENTDQDPANVAEEVTDLEQATAPVKSTEEDPTTKDHEAEKPPEEENHVPEDQHVTSASDQTEEIRSDDAPLQTSDKEALGKVGLARSQHDGEEANTSEDAVKKQPENGHSDYDYEQSADPPVQNAHVEEPTHSDEVAESAPEHDPVKEALGGVEEQTTDEPPIPKAETDRVREETLVLDEDSTSPAKHIPEEANNGQLEREVPQDKEGTEAGAFLPKDDVEMVHDDADQPTAAEPPVAWWEKGTQNAATVQAPVSESSWLSKSLPQDKEQSAVEHPSTVPQFADSTGGDMPESENQEHVEAGEHPKNEHSRAPAAPSTAIIEEHFDEISPLSDIDEENEGPELTTGRDQDAAGNHDAIHKDPHEQQVASEVHSPPILTDGSRGMGWSEAERQTHVEEREVDSASETMEHPDIHTGDAPHEVHDSGINQALNHHLERSALADNTTFEPEVKEPELEPSDTSNSEHTTYATEETGNLEPVEKGSSRGLAGQKQDILNEYAPDGLTLYDESHPSQEDPTWPPQHSTQQEAQSPEQTSHERPTTPTHHPSTYDFAPSTPQHLIQEEHQNSLAESPATVLDTDDLFEDSDDEEEEQRNAGGHDFDPSQETTAQSSEQIEEAQGDTQETPDDAPETRAFFASLVDTIRPDISLLRRLANQEPSPASQHLDDDHSVSEYSQATPGEYYTPGIIEPAEHFPPQNPDAGLHIRTQTADTIPSFESYAHSDEASTPTTPSETASSPFVEEPNEQPTIRSSWQDNSALQGSDPTEEHHELKPQASPLQGEFDPYNTQTYPNYISPKASSVSLRTDDSRNNSFSYSGGVDPPRFSTQSSISPPPVPPKSPRLSSLNTSQASQFSSGRPYDSPVSATRSHHESESPEQYSPTQSRIPRRPTDRTVVAARTPVSSPSIPSNSFFQKTRSLFESASQSPSPPAPTRPLSNLFTVRNSPTSSPSPPRRNPNRPNSLLLSSPGPDEIIPRSLDKDGKPPSPVFTLPGSTPTKGKRLSYDGRQEDSGRYRNSNPFLDGLSKLVGSGGLEDSMHNPNRRLSTKEKEPLLKHAGEMDGY